MSDTPYTPNLTMDLPDATPSKDGLTKLKGTVEHIIYANEDNGYTVLDFGLEDDIVTACGTMPSEVPSTDYPCGFPYSRRESIS